MPERPIKDKVQPILPGQLPGGGRLTMPVGTYLNNPATAAAGMLGGTQPTNIPQISIGPTTSIGPALGSSAQGQGWFAESLKQAFGNLFAPREKQMFNEQGLPVEYEQHSIWNGKETVSYNPVAYDSAGNRYTYDQTQAKYIRDATNALATNQAPSTLSRRAEYLMDFDTSQDITNISDQTLRALFPGKSFEEIRSLMESKGYTYAPGSHGHPGVFMQTGESKDSQAQRSASGAILGPSDERGRPQWVDPTTLAPGERVQVSGGTTYVGGTPTESGQSQYAITVSQNLNKKLEAQGAYKWVSKTVKDKDGNWVRIYSKQLRNVYTKRAKRLREEKSEQSQPQAPVQAPVQQTQDFKQLVTLRVSYG